MVRRRLVLLAVGALLVPVGLAARMLPGGVGDVSGGLLFAGLVYVLCALAAPRVPAIVLGVVTAVIGLGVELLQLTPFPGTIAEAVPAARYVLGASLSRATSSSRWRGRHLRRSSTAAFGGLGFDQPRRAKRLAGEWGRSQVPRQLVRQSASVEGQARCRGRPGEARGTGGQPERSGVPQPPQPASRPCGPRAPRRGRRGPCSRRAGSSRVAP